jgi:hypothetical protein
MSPEEKKKIINSLLIPPIAPLSGGPLVDRSSLEAAEPLAPVTIYDDDNQRAAYEAKLQVRDTFMRRFLWRQVQSATLGITASFDIVDDLQQLPIKIAELDTDIAQYSVDIATRSDRENLLAIEQQRAIVLAISRITGIPSDQIKLVDIVRSSVVLVVDMPLAGAARLVAMERLNHPMLREQGFAHVALDRFVDMQDRPLDSMFDDAVRLAQAELTAATPPSAEASPYTGVDAEARLRITLAEDAARRE